MSAKQTESKITALYERLSRDDDNAGDRGSYNNIFPSSVMASSAVRNR